METLLNKMREAVNNGTAQVLTLEKAQQLKGKKIRTIYFGYQHQDGVDEFVVGDIISELEYYRNLKEESYQNDPKFNNRAEYWESYMTELQLDDRKTRLLLLRQEGTSANFSCHTKYDNFYKEPTFTGSDADREVYFIQL